jgi:hypothetical protein
MKRKKNLRKKEMKMKKREKKEIMIQKEIYS